MFLQMALFHFLWLSTILLYTCTTTSLSIFLVNGHLGGFCVLTTVNNAAMNIGVHVSFRIVFYSESLLYLGFLHLLFCTYPLLIPPGAASSQGVNLLLLLLLSRFSRVRLCATPRRQPTRLLCPWNSPGKNTGVGCHFLLSSASK